MLILPMLISNDMLLIPESQSEKAAMTPHITVSEELVAKIKPGGYILLQKSYGFDGWTIQCREKHLAEPFAQANAPTLEEAIGKLFGLSKT
jgi:hypothetical protein